MDTLTTLQFWSDWVPRVRILPVRQDHLSELALRLPINPQKPRNSAVFG
jgi:hypothetical protein